MEVTQQLHNSEFKGHFGFEDLLGKVRLSIQDYIDLYDLVYNIAYPVNFRKISSKISPKVQAIVSRITPNLPSISYGHLLYVIDEAMTDHPDFVHYDDGIPF